MGKFPNSQIPIVNSHFTLSLAMACSFCYNKSYGFY